MLMAQILVSGLTFCYEGSYDNIFENVSFCIDTQWKLGFIGRNGKGKTTFLNLLLKKYDYEGTIKTPVFMDYFPYPVEEARMNLDTISILEQIQPDYELWKICRELSLLEMDAEILYRPYRTLSHGERTRVMLALLFSRDEAGQERFHLIDEPTNHLDLPTREAVKDYLKSKKGFILVSHDRWLLDECVDHVLVLNRSTIEVVKGNFSTWWDNKERRDAFEKAENEKLKGEISKLEASARRTAAWADRVESTKIGFDPEKEHDRSKDTRAYIGEKSRRMQQRRKNLDRRQQNAIEDKKKLLKDIEDPANLKIVPLSYHKEMYVYARDFGISYKDRAPVVEQVQMELKRGSRIVLRGRNGCGKSSILKAILTAPGAEVLGGLSEEITETKRMLHGTLHVASGLRISYINQDTSGLRGSLDDYIEHLGADGSLFKSVLRQLDFERVQFEKNMEEYSEGQKKKVLIAGSLLQQAHLYIWDEPLNYIDIFSRMQIEELILKFQPTMLLVEHDKAFGDKVATQIIELS